MRALKKLTLRFPQHVVFVWLCSVAQGMAQGTSEPIRITFEGPPVQPPGTAYIVQQYYESGLSFTPIDPNAPWAGFGRCGAATDPRDPANGTAYLQALVAHTLKFSFTNGDVFNLNAVDLAEYSTVAPDAVTVHFVGYRSDGSVLTADLTTDGIIDGTGPLADFQTFPFGPEWNGLTRVEIPTSGWSLDNLVVSKNVPEPGSLALLLAGAVGLWARRRFRAGGPPNLSRV
jgi:hypothetical protein